MDPKIDQSKICTQRPLVIEGTGGSCTFVINIDCLDEADDIKRDNYGVWKHTGSHDVHFQCRINSNGDLEIGGGDSKEGWKKYSLRRLHSKHPDNGSFRRMIATVYGKSVNVIYGNE